MRLKLYTCMHDFYIFFTYLTMTLGLLTYGKKSNGLTVSTATPLTSMPADA